MSEMSGGHLQAGACRQLLGEAYAENAVMDQLPHGCCRRIVHPAARGGLSNVASPCLCNLAHVLADGQVLTLRAAAMCSSIFCVSKQQVQQTRLLVSVDTWQRRSWTRLLVSVDNWQGRSVSAGVRVTQGFACTSRLRHCHAPGCDTEPNPMPQLGSRAYLSRELHVPLVGCALLMQLVLHAV